MILVELHGHSGLLTVIDFATLLRTGGRPVLRLGRGRGLGALSCTGIPPHSFGFRHIEFQLLGRVIARWLVGARGRMRAFLGHRSLGAKWLRRVRLAAGAAEVDWNTKGQVGRSPADIDQDSARPRDGDHL